MKSSTRGLAPQDGVHLKNGRAPNVRQRSTLGVRSRRLLAMLLAGGSATLLSASCAEPQGIVFDQGGSGGGNISPDNPLAERCGLDGEECGTEGCCTAGNKCSGGACYTDVTCEDNNDCNGDSSCGRDRCVAWFDVPASRDFDTDCREPVELDAVQPDVQCRWPKNGVAPSAHPLSVQVISTPMVVDFNFDNNEEVHPSIVVISYENTYGEGNGVIRVIDGKDCTLQTTIDAYSFIPEVPVALGDMNGDGRPEIVAGDRDTSGVAVEPGVSVWEVDVDSSGTGFREIGTRQVSASSALIKGLAIHDLDDALPPEVLTEATIFSFDPQEGLTNLVALEGDRNGALEPPVVADINLDSQFEMVTSQGIMMWNQEELVLQEMTNEGGGVIWDPTDSVLGSFIGLADLGNFRTSLSTVDDSVELVVVGPDDVTVTLVDGSVEFRASGAGNNGGPPVIADFDGDGRMEFAVPARPSSPPGASANFTVYDLDCVEGSDTAADCGGGRGTPNREGILWRKSGLQGAQAGAAVFDFDGDNRAEVVQADQCYMRVFDGVTGEVLFSAPRRSVTAWEYPVVADVDGDSYSEIVTVSNTNNTSVTCSAYDELNTNTRVNDDATPIPGVTVWKDVDDRWMGSRPIWNQHNYYVTNVEDDGTIPRMTDVKSHWVSRQGEAVPNTFRRNVQGATGSSLRRSDLTTSVNAAFICNENGRAEVEAAICNRGLNEIAAEAAEVAFVAANEPTEVLCTETNATALLPGACGTVTCNLPPRGQLRFDVIVTADPRSEVDECYEGNNRSMVPGVFCVGPVQ